MADEGDMPRAETSAGSAALSTAREENRRLLQVLDATTDLVGMSDAQGMTLFLNPSFRRILGIDPDEDLSRVSIATFHPPAVAEEILNVRLPQAVKDGSWKGESKLQTRAGQVIPVSQVIVAHPSDNGEPEYFSTIMRDISAQLAIERRMSEAQKSESLGLMAGGVAHDFNNLLVGILGNVSLLLEDLPQHSESRGLAVSISRAAERAADLARQMLAYAGRAEIEPTDLDLSALVAETAHLLSASIPKHVRLLSDLHSPLPLVHGDATQIGQILVNLVINAAESIGERSGEVEIRTLFHRQIPKDPQLNFLPEAVKGGVVSLSVTDSGAGMDEATLARIFDPFFSTKFTGRGLGLSSVMGIVRAHDGALRVDSAPNEGATFTLHLPVSAAARRSELPRAEEADTPRPMRVLVVDDEPIVLQVCAAVISRLGYEPVVAENGIRAVELAGADPSAFHAAIVDLTMPGMSGVDVVRALKGLRPDLPVVLSSGYPESDLQGADGFLLKPYTPAAVDSALKNAVAGAVVSPDED